MERVVFVEMPQTHSRLIGYYLKTVETTKDVWNQFHIYLNYINYGLQPRSSRNLRLQLITIFSKFPIILNKLLQVDWNTTFDNNSKLKRLSLIKQTLYSQIKRLKAKENYACLAVKRSENFNCFTFIIYRGKKINLQFTRSRILGFLYNM
jgi:hypothetical protein